MLYGNCRYWQVLFKPFIYLLRGHRHCFLILWFFVCFIYRLLKEGNHWTLGMAWTEFVANSFYLWKWEWHKYICQRKNTGSCIIVNIANDRCDRGWKTIMTSKEIWPSISKTAPYCWKQKQIPNSNMLVNIKEIGISAHYYSSTIKTILCAGLWTLKHSKKINHTVVSVLSFLSNCHCKALTSFYVCVLYNTFSSVQLNPLALAFVIVLGDVDCFGFTIISFPPYRRENIYADKCTSFTLLQNCIKISSLVKDWL